MRSEEEFYCRLVIFHLYMHVNMSTAKCLQREEAEHITEIFKSIMWYK